MSTLFIHNALLFDGVRFRDGRWSVLVKDGVVERVLPADRGGRSEAESARGEAGGRVVDASGMTLLPGLIDLHVHLTWSAGADPASVVVKESPERTLLRAVAHAEETLRSGVTAVRDLGSMYDQAIELSRVIREGIIEGCRVVACGRTIVMTGGHDPFWGNMVDGPAEARKAVRTQIFKGAQVIKVSATGGAYGRPEGESVDDVELLPDELTEIVRVAHSFGRRVASHAIGEQGIQNSLDAGVDTIEHGHFLTEEQAASMAARGQALVPTAQVYRTLATSPDVPTYAREKAAAITGRHREAVEIARRAGVAIGVGSDAGSTLTPHPSAVDELLCLVEYGLGAEEALAAGTSVAARILGASELGEVAEGKVADLVLVGGDLADDLQALRDVRVVVKDGRIVRRDEA